AGLRGLIRIEQPGRQIRDGRVETAEQLASVVRLPVQGQAHAETELGIVLEQRVGPRGTTSVRVRRPRRGRLTGTVDRRAAGGVRDDRAVTEELAHGLEVRSLATPRARAGELEQRFEELYVLHQRRVQRRARGSGQ